MEFGMDASQNGTVISVLLPINEKIRLSNRNRKEWASKEYAVFRAFGDAIISKKVGKYTEKLLDVFGYKAVSP